MATLATIWLAYITRCQVACLSCLDCEAFLRPVLDALQRVMDEYSSERPTSKGGRPYGLASPAGSSASQWESAEHVQTNISHLSSTLAGVDARHLQNAIIVLSEPGRLCA